MLRFFESLIKENLHLYFSWHSGKFVIVINFLEFKTIIFNIIFIYLKEDIRIMRHCQTLIVVHHKMQLLQRQIMA